MKKKPTPHQSRLAAVKAAGGSALNLILSPEATLALDRLQAKRGETKTAIIERLLMRAAARVE
jgi:hypothetical protein